MSPIDFIFALFGPFFQISPEAVENLHQSASDWYEKSAFKDIISKYWFIPLLLPLVYPFVSKFVNRLYDSIGDQDQDNDIDLNDLLVLLQQKIEKAGVK